MWNTFYMLQHTECSYASPGSPCMRTILAMRSCHTCKQQRLWGMSMLTCQQGLYRECQCSHAKSYTAILLALFPGFTNQGSSSLWVTDLQLNIQWWYIQWSTGMQLQAIKYMHAGSDLSVFHTYTRDVRDVHMHNDMYITCVRYTSGGIMLHMHVEVTNDHDLDRWHHPSAGGLYGKFSKDNSLITQMDSLSNIAHNGKTRFLSIMHP